MKKYDTQLLAYDEYYTAAMTIADKLIDKNILAGDLHLGNIGLKDQRPKLIDHDGLYKINVYDNELKERWTSTWSGPYDVDRLVLHLERSKYTKKHMVPKSTLTLPSGIGIRTGGIH